MPLSSCPNSESLSGQLDAATDADGRDDLLKTVKKKMCGDLTKQKRVHICCPKKNRELTIIKNNCDLINSWILLYLAFEFVDQDSGHGVSGTLEYKDESTFIVRNFKYDGEGPSTIFIVGKEGREVDEDVAIPVPYPAIEGNQEKLPFDSEEIEILGAFDGSEDIELKLPQGVTANDVKWISVYCRLFAADFAHVILPDVESRNWEWAKPEGAFATP